MGKREYIPHSAQALGDFAAISEFTEADWRWAINASEDEVARRLEAVKEVATWITEELDSLKSRALGEYQWKMLRGYHEVGHINRLKSRKRMRAEGIALESLGDPDK